MNPSNNTGNGCTLEDCHTNLFALTDLAGIKYRKLGNDGTFCVEPLDDPVLLSFTRCIQSDILCVWRRVPHNNSGGGPVSQNMHSHKELWIFWYGDEPVHLPNLLAPELQDQEHGSWDIGLSYECRTLLFKALHNLIERCLLSQNFVRIGKWFVQPYPHFNSNTCGIIDKSSHLSIRFSFFLHGESTVCASIDVREHPPLRNLHPQHLTIASQSPVPVILAPYGLAATLTGQSYRETDHNTQKLLEEWKQFYLLPNWDRVDGVPYGDNSHVAPVVEVVVAGMRMKYPSCFVMMLAEKEAELIRQQDGTPVSTAASTTTTTTVTMPSTPAQSGIPSVSMTSPPSPCILSVLPGESPTKSNPTPISGYLFVPTLEPGMDPVASAHVGKRITEKSWQDASITSGSSTHRHQQTENTGGPEDKPAMTWEYGEPLVKSTCVCSRTRGSKSRPSGPNLNKPNVNNPNKHIKPEKGEKGDREKTRHSQGSTPFHRRTSHADALLQQKMDHMMQRIPPTSLASVKPLSSNISTSSSSNPQNSGIPQLRGSSSAMDNNPESPHSSAPSPLPVSQIQPSVSQNGDPTMPTLSPHPPSKNSDKDLGASGSLQGELHEPGPPAQNPAANGEPPGMGVGPCGPAGIQPPTSNADPFIRPSQQVNPKVENINPFHNSAEVVKADNVNTWLDVQKQKLQCSINLKRPVVPTQGYEEDEEELVTEALYNFASVHAFLEQPIKKCRMDHENFNSRPGPQPPSLSMHKGGRQRDKSPPQQPQYDPYEFSDDSSSDPGNFSSRTFRNESFSRSPFGSKQEEDYGGRVEGFPTKSSLDLSPETPGTVTGLPVGLMREEDLKPNVNDLDNIFDTDSESSDQDPTGRLNLPGAPNHISAAEESGRSVVSRNTNCNNTSVASANMSELTQMFPTPPSQEPHQHTLSPGNMTEIVPDLESISTKMEPIMHEEHTKSHILDWSYVYKPPLVCKYEGSSKYAPVDLGANHPELHMIPAELHYKPSWHQFPHMPIMDKHHQPPPPPPPPPSHYPNLPSVENIGSVGTKAPDRMPSIESSPATFGMYSAPQRTPRTPSYELQSPASNASSYMKNLNSVDNHPTNSQRPEGHSLVVNVMLSDSILNLFKDHNFDSCSMCVCNMNIKGTDIVNYLPDKTPEVQYNCKCGFSAIVNRKYGNNSGLFYEDEVDITGIRSERLEHRKPSLASLLNQDSKDLKDKLDTGEVMPQELLVLLQSHFSSLFPSCIVPRNIISKHLVSMHSQEIVSFMELQDGSEACLSALEVGRQAADNCISQRLDEGSLRNSQLLHKWPFLQSAKTPTNSQDVVRLLKSLQPLLQDAIQKKRTTRLWESVYTILGPLTWKDFHLLAGRGPKETSGPQPVPPLLVGYDKDWLALPPFTLRHWERLMLEPFSQPRDMAYVIITPDNKFILSHISAFFKELGRTYEACRFGRHRPFTKQQFKDGILRINQNYYNKVAEETVDDWFFNLGSSSLATKLRQYTQVCSKYLAPFLAAQTLDKSIFESPPSSRPPPQRSQASDSQGQSQTHSQSFHSQNVFSANPSSSCPPSSIGQAGSQQPTGASSSSNNPDSQTGTSQTTNQDDKEGDSQSTNKESTQETETESADSQMPCLVIYMVDPFTYGEDWDNMNRLATLSLLRCYQEMLKALPEQLQQCTQLQIIPQQAIVDFQETPTTQYLKNVCMSVYTQSRKLLTHAIPGRSLTGFGPAAAAERVLKSKEEHQVGAVHLYSPPYILGNLKNVPAKVHDSTDTTGVMLCAYCLSEDQRWLLAVCTDHNGEVLETCTINIDIPNRNRRKKASARKVGLTKLWDFIVGVLSQTAKSWRLVVGRFGRLGHGELKGWACLLNKKNLQTTSAQLRQLCPQCEILSQSGIPSVVSACLVSMESHPSIHITPDSLSTVEERPASNCQLSTPKDASCTHILVFPTSACAQATQEAPKDAHLDALHESDLSGGEEKDLLDDFSNGLTAEELIGIDGGFGGFDDFLGTIIMPDPAGSPQNPSNPDSPTPTDIAGRHSPMGNGFPKSGGASFGDMQEENHSLLAQTLLQQPLAMGFYVSTAKTGPLPKWFWGACPHREDVCPVCFKAALHIHCPNVHQTHDDFDSSSKRRSHPLDSNLTCDVLRYVLETYNALSWLTIDSATNDRRSCLPAHIVVLMQLYHAVNSLV